MFSVPLGRVVVVITKGFGGCTVIFTDFVSVGNAIDVAVMVT